MFPVLLCAWAGHLSAQLVCYDGFEGYSAGVQLESGGTGSDGTGRNGGLGWGGAYDVSNPIKLKVKVEDRSAVSPGPVSYSNGGVVLSGGIRALRFYDNANGSYAVRRALGGVFSAAAGEALWFSVLFRTASQGASPLMDEDFFQIGFDDNPNANSGIPRVGIGSAIAPAEAFPAAYHFFAGSSADPLARALHTSLPIAAVTTYLLVGQIQPTAGAYNTVNLFVNPTSLTDPGPPSATSTASSGLTTLSHLFIRTVGLDSGDAYVLDEWRIGRNYGAVVGSLDNLLTITPASVPGGLPTLSWPALMPGVVLESSSTLAPDSWELVSAGITNSAGRSNYTIPAAPAPPRLFLRLRR